MNMTIDASIIVAIIVNEKKKYRLLELTAGKNLIAPSNIHNEILQIFLLMNRRNWIRNDQLGDAINIYQKIPIRRVDIPLQELALLSQKLNISANDAGYLLTAKKYKAPLLTIDHNLAIPANKFGIRVIEG